MIHNPLFCPASIPSIIESTLIARVVQYIKSQSAKAFKAKFPFLQKAYMTREGIWSRGYCVSCIGLDEKEILAYVEHQEKDDKGQLQLMF